MHKEAIKILYIAKASRFGIDVQLNLQLRNDQEYHRNNNVNEAAYFKQFNIFHIKDCLCMCTEKIRNP